MQIDTMSLCLSCKEHSSALWIKKNGLPWVSDLGEETEMRDPRANLSAFIIDVSCFRLEDLGSFFSWKQQFSANYICQGVCDLWCLYVSCFPKPIW